MWITDYAVVPLLTTLGLALVFVGLYLMVAGLYKGIPYEAETLEDRSKDILRKEDREQIKAVGLRGLGLVALGLAVVAVAAWLQWAAGAA